MTSHLIVCNPPARVNGKGLIRVGGAGRVGFVDTHVARWKIYLEDTDAGGVVYHANYLKFLERSRTDLLESRGSPPVAGGDGSPSFVVHEVYLKHLRPARLGQTIEVHTRYQRASDYRLSFEQEIRLPGQPSPLLTATVQVVAVDPAGKLVELPAGLDP